MTEHNDADAEQLISKRFDVELFIVHPKVDPADISTALGLDAKFAHRVGDQRKTPAGTLLPGVHRETRWRHSRRYETVDQWFADKVVDLIDRLEPHKEFLKELTSSGGQTCVIVQFLGQGYFGDRVPKDILSRLADMDLDLGIECFTVPQGAGGMKNIQVIDGAQNCTFSIFQARCDEFALLFPEPKQDIQYAEDLATLQHQEGVKAALAQIWERPIRKQNALGIHGTLFYQLDRYKAWYSEKREDAVTSSAVNQAQRRLFRTVP